MFIQNIELLCFVTSGVMWKTRNVVGVVCNNNIQTVVAVVTDGNNYKKMTAECEEIFLTIPCP